MPDIRVMLVENEAVRGRDFPASGIGRDRARMRFSSVTSCEEAIKRLEPPPDIMLLDPGALKGRTLTWFQQAIATASPKTRILLFLRSLPSDEELIAGIKTGLRGYLRADDPSSIMLKAIQAVFDGELWAERRILEKAISGPGLKPEPFQLPTHGLPLLTNREREMLTLLLQGASNKEIASRSSISERTVKTHLYRVYRKLNVKSRTKAIALLAYR